MVKKVEDRIEEYRSRVLDMTDEALDTINEKLYSQNHAVALRAALEILGINGISGTKKTESTVTITQKSELDARIEELLSRGGTHREDTLGVATGYTDSDEERVE